MLRLKPQWDSKTKPADDKTGHLRGAKGFARSEGDEIFFKTFDRAR